MSNNNFGCGDYLRERGVTRLVHLTYWSMLPAILKHGLKPNQPGFDSQRLDGTRDLCFSFQYPNVSMFFARCKQHQNDALQEGLKWSLEDEYVAVTVDPNLADRSDARFYATNAAFKYAQPLSGVNGIKNVFADDVQTKKGIVSRYDLPDFAPTSMQAEILFRLPISPSEMRVVFPYLERGIKYEEICGKIPACINIDFISRLFAFSEKLCISKEKRDEIWRYEDKRRTATCEHLYDNDY